MVNVPNSPLTLALWQRTECPSTSSPRQGSGQAGQGGKIPLNPPLSKGEQKDKGEKDKGERQRCQEPFAAVKFGLTHSLSHP